MLPVDADGEPLMNAVLYGVDTRAAKEIEELTAAIGEDTLLDRCGNALTSQSVGPKILWLKRNRPEIFAKTAQDPDLDLLPRAPADRRLRHRPLLGGQLSARSTSSTTLDWSDALAGDIVELELLPELGLDDRHRRRR